ELQLIQRIEGDSAPLHGAAPLLGRVLDTLERNQCIDAAERPHRRRACPPRRIGLVQREGARSGPARLRRVRHDARSVRPVDSHGRTPWTDSYGPWRLTAG